MAVIGASVCRDGWFAVRIDDDHARPANARAFPDMAALMDAWGGASSILVGMPIGLPDAGRRDQALILGGERPLEAAAPQLASPRCPAGR